MKARKTASQLARMKRPQKRATRGAALLSAHAWCEIADTLAITKRELEIVQAVFDSLTQKEIANRLTITEHTAHTHLNRLFKKLNVRSRTELVLCVLEQMIALTLSEAGVLPPICPHHQSGDCCRHISCRRPKTS